MKRSRDKATSSLLSVSEFASDGFYDLPFLSSGSLSACTENEKVVILFETRALRATEPTAVSGILIPLVPLLRIRFLQR